MRANAAAPACNVRVGGDAPLAWGALATDPIDVVTEREGQCDFVRMRWGLVPWWSSSRSRSCERRRSMRELRRSKQSRSFAMRSNARDV